mmetsp:Transcript_3394/g.4604  ORF Transcript_3394/g.4604 Transcript_3394/m.4604 type:complete len:244 (-) Transcript_3394:52-783(-)
MSSSNRPTSDNHYIMYKHCVKFSNNTKVSFIPGLRNISDEEINATWFTEKDCAKIQASMVKTVKRMRKGNMDEEKYCSRGLEHMRTADDAKQRKANRDAARTAVLAEHKRQSLLGYYDPIEVCKVSTFHSKGTRDAALRLGESDAAAVHPSRSRSDIGHEMNTSCHESQSSSATQPIASEECAAILESALKVANSTQDCDVNMKGDICHQPEESCLSSKQNVPRNTLTRVISKINSRFDIECV